MRWTLLVGCTFGLTFGLTTADLPSASADTKRPAAARAGKAKARAKAPAKVNEKSKKALGELMGEYKFGMSKEDVVGIVGKELDVKYKTKLESTTDVYAQDKLRKERKSELARFASSWTAFDGKRTGWDVSLVESEFAHNTGEAMLVLWENQDGKNQRRFFFFSEGQLYKMFISLDTSAWPEETRNFDTFRGSMEGRYGNGDVEDNRITWRAGDFEVRALDKLKTYSALCLTIYNPSVAKALEGKRTEAAPIKPKSNGIIDSVIDDGSSRPDIRRNGDTVEAVKNAK